MLATVSETRTDVSSVFDSLLRSTPELAVKPDEYTHAVKFRGDRHISPAELRPLMGTALRAASQISLYLHMPVCGARCTFCHYPTVVQPDAVGHWVDLLLAESRIFLSDFQNRVSSLPVTSVYLGGGTPALMTSEQLHRVLGHVRGCYSLGSASEITIEGTPETMTARHLDEICGAGVNRVSIGVQTLRTDLLRQMNRRHDARAALTSVKSALRTGFRQVNVDLIYGLPSQDAGQFLEDVDAIISLRPTSITLYRLRLGRPGELQTDLGRRFQEDPAAFPPPLETYVMQELGRRALLQAGYEEGPAGWFRLPGNRIQVYSDRWDTQGPMIAFGWWTYSYSSLYEYHNLTNRYEYAAAVRRGELPVLTAVEFSLSERVRRFFAFRLKSRFEVSRQDLINSFGPDEWKAPLSKALALLDRAALLNEDHQTFSLNRNGRLLIEEVIEAALMHHGAAS